MILKVLLFYIYFYLISLGSDPIWDKQHYSCGYRSYLYPWLWFSKFCSFWIYCYLISLASTLQWLSLSLEILIIMMPVFIAFPLTLRGKAPRHHKAFNYFCANWYIYEIFHERISLTVEILLLFPKFRKSTGQNWCIYSS